MTRLHTTLVIAVCLTACTVESASGADAGASDKAGPTDQKAKPSETPKSGDPSLGQLKATEFIDLAKLINKTPDEVDAILGEPKATGTDRISCVRFVPDRVFFACEQTIHLYEHNQFEQIRVEFEDGRSALVALSGLPGEGEFNADAALATVGVSLPDKPRHDNPPMGMNGEEGDVVDRWHWGNSSARLLVDGLEHRVQLSVVNGEWRRAKLEIIVNHPLTDDQKSRIKQPKNTPDSAPDSTPAP